MGQDTIVAAVRSANTAAGRAVSPLPLINNTTSQSLSSVFDLRPGPALHHSAPAQIEFLYEVVTNE